MKKRKLEIRWEKILHNQKLIAFLHREKQTEDYISQMYPRENKEKMFLTLWGKRLLVFAVLLSAVIVSAVFGFLSEPEKSRLTEGKYITRGEEDEVLVLTLLGTTGENQWEKTMSLNVKERQFTKQEKEKLTKETEQYIKNTLAGENDSFDHICKKLQLISSVPGTGILLQWVYDDNYIRESGDLKRDAIPSDGVDTELMAKARWKNWKKTFYFPVRLFPLSLSDQEAAVKNIKKQVKEVMREQADREVVELPTEIGGTKLRYEAKEGGKDFSMLYICIFVAFMFPVCLHQKQKKEIQNREEQLLLDYPTLVNRIMLLLGAGLTVRKAVERMADEYEENRRKGGGVRYVYEEICVMVHQMRDGVSESRAIEQFGRRCRLLPYLRFSSVITQNLKKGADGIIDILEKESLEALEQRKERVLQLGETAGTRLLFPMMIMLGLVMGIIMVPAFMSM